jgi:hypothetical protein
VDVAHDAADRAAGRRLSMPVAAVRPEEVVAALRELVAA